MKHAGLILSILLLVSLVEAASLKIPNPSGLYLYLPMTEGTGAGTAIDKSGNSRTGTYEGAPTWAQGKFGDAPIFDAATKRISLGSNTLFNFGAGDYTFICWAKRNSLSTPGGDFIIAKDYDGANRQFGFYLDGEETGSNRVILFVFGATMYYYLEDGAATNDLKWHQVAAGRRGGSLFINIDGKNAPGTLTNSIVSMNSKTTYSYVGARGGFDVNSFNGQIQHLMVFERALSDAEMAAMYFSKRAAYDAGSK